MKGAAMEWQLFVLPALLLASLAVLMLVKTAIGEGKTGPRDHSSMHEAEAVIRARGGPGPG
jgi:hypothetical protein